MEAYAGTIERYMGPGEAMGGTTHGVGWGRRNYHPGQKAGEARVGPVTRLEGTAQHFLFGTGQLTSIPMFIPIWVAAKKNSHLI